MALFVDRNSMDLYYKIGGFVVDRKSIDLLTKSVRTASEMRLAYGQGHFDAIMRGGGLL